MLRSAPDCSDGSCERRGARAGTCTDDEGADECLQRGFLYELPERDEAFRHGEVELSKDFHDSCLARIANHVVRPHLYHLLLFKDFLKPCPGGWRVRCHNRDL
ncbi:hypothetical protein MTO96_045622 [Rhipicephalus appendiculatus]